MVLPGCDWVVIQLGQKGVVSELEVDTHFYKGNYPESVLVEDRLGEEGDGGVLLNRSRLGPGRCCYCCYVIILCRQDAIHRFSVSNGVVVSQVKMTIFPDGGVMRLRVIGKSARDCKL